MGSEHYWRKVQVVLSGKKDASTGAMITVLANGEIVSMLPWKDIKGTDTASFDVEINNRVPIIVAGYITNKDVFFSGGLEVKLIGFYKEGE